MNPKAYKMFSMENKVVVITGGAGFLGTQFAICLGKAGAKVVIWDSCDFDRLQASAIRLRLADIQNFVVMKVDITDEQKVKEAVNTVVARLGSVDVLINNAAMNPEVGSEESKQMFAPYDEYSIESWKEELKVNLTGMLICTQAVAPIMKKRRSGVIVNIASEFANIAADNRVYGGGKFKSIGYITAKHGVIGMTRAWASDLGGYGIRVNAFSPGGMPKSEVPEEFRKRYSASNMLGRMAEFNEYNGAMLFLCSDASLFMTGQQLIVDGGKSAW